jgi:hypothetical protein
MKTEKIFTFLLASILLTFVGCATNSAETSEEINNKVEAAVAKLLQSTKSNSNAEAAAVAPNAASSDTRDLVVGVWRFEHPYGDIECVSELIFESNGAHSGMTQCGPYAVQRTGKWSLNDNNTMRISYTDGKPIRWDTWHFKMLDRNRMALGDGAIIAYRVQ